MKARYEAVYVEVDGIGVPVRLVWRGRLYRVVEVQDRWRYAGQWWLDGRGWRRAYWVVKAQRPQQRAQDGLRVHDVRTVPAGRELGAGARERLNGDMVHLHVHSWFSFGGGASSPQVLAERASVLGQSALALTDDWSLAGAVQHARACREYGLKAIFGARVCVAGLSLVLLCADNAGYANLCDLLTLAHRERLNPTLDPTDLQDKCEGLFCLVDFSPPLLGAQWKVLRRAVGFLRSIFGTRLFVELVHHHHEGDSARLCTAGCHSQ